MSVGPYASNGGARRYLIEPIAFRCGLAFASNYFSSADSFAMIRGGHIDLSVLGAMQVAAVDIGPFETGVQTQAVSHFSQGSQK